MNMIASLLHLFVLRARSIGKTPKLVLELNPKTVNKINTYYTRMTYYYIHRNGHHEETARNKAFYKTTIVIGVFSFFIYAMIMNIGNQLVFNLENSRTNGYLIVGPFVLLVWLLAEKKLRRHLHLVEEVSEYDADKLKAYNNFQIRVAVIAGIYCIIMFCLIRLTNMYFL